MDRPRLFISAVSQELRTARQSVAATLRTLGFDPVSQDDFPTGHGELRHWLFEQIDASEGLIQLAGEAYGAEPPDVDPAWGRVSYTQLEFLYARQQGKKTWLIVIGDEFPRDHRVAQLDLPEGLDRVEAAKEQAARRALQRDYIEGLKRDNQLRHTAENQIELDNLVLRLRDELAVLREEERDRWNHLGSRLDEIQTGVEKASSIDAGKIRGQLRTSIDATYLREVADSDTASGWETRERLREAAKVAHVDRLSRIEELVNSFEEIAGTARATRVFEEMKRTLAEEGVDAAIAYIATRRLGILEQVRARAAAAQARNRAELQPLLETATLYNTRGQSAEARALYADILALDADWDEANHRYFWFLTDAGDTARVRGSIVDSEHNYAHAHGLAQRSTERDPSNAEWHRNLSVSYNRIGNIRVAHGDGPAALVAYCKSHEITAALAARDPADIAWQRDLSLSHERIGDVLFAQGDQPGALAAYCKSLEIRKALAARGRANAEWQHDLLVSHIKIGNVLVTQGDGPGALSAFRKSLEIAEALAARDPANTEWQRDLSVSHNRVGDVLVTQGIGSGALAAFRKGLQIAEVLAAHETANTGWQRDLSVSYEKIGDVLVAQGDGSAALVDFRKSLEIRESLVARDSANAEWQHDLIVNYVKLSEVTVEKAYVLKSLKVAEDMQARGILAPRDAWMIEDLKRRAGR